MQGNSAESGGLAERVFRSYEALSLLADGDAGLGGKLCYAGEIDDRGRELLYAANIAGAASIAASPEAAVQRQAVRDGVIDFLVTSLEEALRILKNEIRKRQPVSVGVAIAPFRLLGEMIERGVLPDLLPAAAGDLFGEEADGFDIFVGQGARQLPSQADGFGRRFVTWSTDREFTRWLPLIDRSVQAIVPEEDRVRQRWLRLAPRYLGRAAQREHGVGLDAVEFERLQGRVEELRAGAEGEGGSVAAIILHPNLGPAMG